MPPEGTAMFTGGRKRKDSGCLDFPSVEVGLVGIVPQIRGLEHVWTVVAGYS